MKKKNEKKKIFFRCPHTEFLFRGLMRRGERGMLRLQRRLLRFRGPEPPLQVAVLPLHFRVLSLQSGVVAGQPLQVPARALGALLLRFNVLGKLSDLLAQKQRLHTIENQNHDEDLESFIFQRMRSFGM